MRAGVDEAGRGPLAGPVVAAAVVLDAPIPGLDDSKRLSPARREALAAQIQQQARACALGLAAPAEIDALNAEVAADAEAAVAYALDAKYPDASEVDMHVFTDIEHTLA